MTQAIIWRRFKIGLVSDARQPIAVPVGRLLAAFPETVLSNPPLELLPSVALTRLEVTT